jgi:hypothetical protein
MRRNLVFFSILALVLVLTVSCKKKTVKEEAQVHFESLAMNEKHHLNNDTNNPALNISLKLEYPAKFSDTIVLDKIRKDILTDFLPDIDKNITDPKLAMSAYIKEYVNFFEKSEKGSIDAGKFDEDNQPEYAWWDNEKMVLRYNDNNILSYTISSDRYTGGAHDGKNFLNTSINLKTGERITEEDLFTEASRPLISEIILKKIMEMHQAEKPEDLEQIGFFDVTEIGMNKNFYITDKGITYTYNQYEIAAYAVGTIEVFLSYKDISGFLISGCPVEQFVH